VSAPPIDDRSERDRVDRLLATPAAHLPGWRPRPGEPATALVWLYARLAQALATRLNAAPDRLQLAWYDRLGLSLLPAQPARAPVAFQGLPGAGDSRVPAGTRIGAKVKGRSEPLVFETETAVALASGRIVEVVSLDPGGDRWTDHSEPAVRGQQFTMFDRQSPIPHILYLAHPVQLALRGPSVLEVEVELASPAEAPLASIWEYWDGDAWREFAAMDPAPGGTGSYDGTAGWTRSGTVRLVTPCARTLARRIGGIESFWIRCRLLDALPPRDGARLAAVASIRITAVIDRRLPPPVGAVNCAALGDGIGLVPEQAYADGTRLDLTRAVQPLGAAPQAGNAWYLSLEDAFSRPGAEVTLCFRKVVTPEEEADAKAAAFEAIAQSAPSYVVAAARKAADAALDVLDAAMLMVLPITDPVGYFRLILERGNLVTLRAALATQGLGGVAPVRDEIATIFGLLDPFIGVFTPPPVPLPTPSSATLATNLPRLIAEKEFLDGAMADLKQLLDQLSGLTPLNAALGAGAAVPAMPPPVVRWEYWNGSAWTGLTVTAPNPLAITLRADGPVSFEVRDDMEPLELNGVRARWIRARLIAGGYGTSRMVSWKDQDSGKIQFMAVVQHRPPTLDRVRAGYRWRSLPAPPSWCFAENDFRLADRSDAAQGEAAPFPPYEPVPDRTPTVYLGFDRPLPADRIGLFIGAEEAAEPVERVTLAWEAWDGAAWVPVDADDGTDSFTLPGIVSLSYPGAAPLPSARLGQAAGITATLATPADAIRFASGDLLEMVAPDGSGEVVTAASVGAGAITLARPLERTYAGGTVSVARLPRFGRPRTWLRARYAADASPIRRTIEGLFSNATWAVQASTIERETIGSGTGEAEQTLFARHMPLLDGERLEVRELDGARARVEVSVLQEELAARGAAPDDLRIVSDPRTGFPVEAWVRWTRVPALQFAGRDQRAYIVERSRGRLSFGGDGESGRTLPAARDNVQLVRYRSGGGSEGNVPAGAINQLLAGVLASGVFGCRPAEGGADTETLARVAPRGAAFVRHRRQAISAADYEALALESSPGVAAARALPATDPAGRRVPGQVTLFVLPRSGEARPLPTLELRRGVRDFILARCPPAVRAGLAVLPPRFLSVGVDATLAVTRADQAGAVRAAVLAALAGFLHPVNGGPEGAGWPFGRDVFLSDVAAVVERVPGVDAVTAMTLTVEGAPAGDRAAVAPDLLIVAGAFDLRIAGRAD
jgi:predicted phage baseplate assembly protein